MKRACVLILAYHLVFIVQYAASETYKEWYQNTVRNCTLGSTVKYYKPNMVCKCSQPGVIESCQFLGTRDNSAIMLRGTTRTAENGKDWKPKQPCFTLALPIFDGCNWCGCDGGKHTCTKNPCLKKLKGSTNIGMIVESGTLNINTFGPEKCPEKSYQHEDGCNWCTCTNGWLFCTIKHCPKKKQEVNKCLNNPDGGFYSDDGCNWCSCGPDNTALCTRRGCIKENTQSVQARDPCKGKWFGRVLMPDGCNTCACLFGQSTACTIMYCPEPEETLTNKSRNPCKGKWLGRVLMPDGCNTCACRFGKTTACTIKRCPEPVVSLTKKLSSSVCKNGSRRVKPDECNVCLCDNRGVAVCTVKYCPGKKSVLNKKKQKKNIALLQGKKHNPANHRMKLYALKEKAQSCKVGEKFKQPYATCNWCTCVEDGVVTCDMEVCPGDSLEGEIN